MPLNNTFKYLSIYRQCEGIVFDLYVQNSVKQGERDRRKKEEAININIYSSNQLFPVKLESFWASFKNKEQFQIFLFVGPLKHTPKKNHYP